MRKGESESRSLQTFPARFSTILPARQRTVQTGSQVNVLREAEGRAPEPNQTQTAGSCNAGRHQRR